MRLKSICCLFILLQPLSKIYAQLRVLDKSTGTPVAHTELIINGFSTGVFTNTDGEIVVKLAKGDKTFGFFALGYTSVIFDAEAVDTLTKVYMEPLGFNLRDVVIIDSFRPAIQVNPGVLTVDASKMSKLPTIFAEPDLLKTLQLLPGVSSVLENNVGLYVRGGKADQSLISIDGATIYNPAHSVGFFSVVHPSAVSSATLYKDGIPATEGSRASAFLDIKLKEGNYNKFRGTLSIGAISSYLDLQGPISKGKHPTSFQFVGRTTYIDRLAKALSYIPPSFNTGFDDYSFKIASKLSERRKVTTAYYHSDDYFKLAESSYINIFNLGNNSNWHNDILSMNYINSKSEKWLKTTSMSFSKYRLSSSFMGYSQLSSIKDFGTKYGYKAIDYTKLIQEIGVQATYHSISPGHRIINSDSLLPFIQPFTMANQQFLEVAPYLSLYKLLAPGWEVDAHLRISNYLATDMQSIQPEPRISLRKRYANASFSISYDRLSQFMQLYSANITPMPNDVWYMSGGSIKPVTSNSVSLSYNKTGYQKSYQFTSSLYYRYFNHVSDIAAGGSTLITPDYQKMLRTGHNQSYGFEFLLQKQKGSFTGWISYTYSRSINFIDGILDKGNRYRASYDKPHLLNVTANKKLGKWELNGVFVLQSGRPVTIPLYTIGVISIYSQRNERRLPLYHRLDLSLIHYQKKHKHFQASWMISIYNVYYHKNVYNIQYNPFTRTVDYLTLFPVLPMASYKAEIF
ncbi:TonB-dependent receptor plug domain-containing protein [bacterium]|nr:TonB-dependent receptor plug domain-containing protein [bacterium]